MDKYNTIKDLPLVVQKAMVEYGHNFFSIINVKGEMYCSTRYKPRGLIKSVSGRPCIYKLLGENSYRLSIEDTNKILEEMKL